MASNNPISIRLEKLQDQWREFRENSKAVLLHWIFKPNEFEMLRAFLEVENSDRGEFPDVFFTFTEPFSDYSSYGFSIAESLAAKYTELRADIEAADLQANWKCPPKSDGENDLGYLMRAAHSLQKHYEEFIEQLVLVLTPESIKKKEDWIVWLENSVIMAKGPGVRLVIPDNEQLQFQQLPASELEKVLTRKADLNMDAAYNELVQASGESGSGQDFRVHFVACVSALGNKDLPSAQTQADKALAVCEKEKWPNLSVAIHLAMGSGYLAAKDYDRSLTMYDCARKKSDEYAATNPEAGAKLAVQSIFGKCGVLVVQKRNEEAAAGYEEAATIAADHKEELLQLEGLRMAAFCHWRNKNPEEALRCGNAALDAGEKMAPEKRSQTTLPFVGKEMLAIAKKWLHRPEREQLENRLSLLLGENWEESGDA
jgi:hypothetical protein